MVKGGGRDGEEKRGGTSDKFVHQILGHKAMQHHLDGGSIDIV
jgi:hypothetical protein